jgi:hypothetical protein
LNLFLLTTVKGYIKRHPRQRERERSSRVCRFDWWLSQAILPMRVLSLQLDWPTADSIGCCCFPFASHFVKAHQLRSYECRGEIHRWMTSSQDFFSSSSSSSLLFFFFFFFFFFLLAF